MYRHSSPLRAPRALAVALALCIAPAPAAAQKVLTECSVKEVAKILTSMGLEVKDSKDEGKQSYVRFELGGYRVALILYNENTDAQLYAGFADWKVTPEKVKQGAPARLGEARDFQALVQARAPAPAHPAELEGIGLGQVHFASCADG